MKQEWMKRENVIKSSAKHIVFSNNMCCLNKLARQRKSGLTCHLWCDHRHFCVHNFKGSPFDHSELYKCRHDKYIILVSHPYDEPSGEIIRFIETKFPLRVTVFPKETSWYFPGRTYRFEIRQV